MLKNPKAMQNKKPDFVKLTEYGFVKSNGRFVYSSDIVNGTFSLNVYISENGVAELEVIDKATDEEYALAYNADCGGSFVGGVRSEYEEILSDIAEQCFEPDIFKSYYARLIIRYIWEKYSAKAEYLWKDSPENAVFREPISRKWYAAILTVKSSKVNSDSGGTMEIIDLKGEPQEIERIVDGINYLAGYHMNKKHWYTIRLDGSVPIEEIYRRIDKSYTLIKK